MSLLLASPPGAPLRKPLAGRGAFPLSMAAIIGEEVCVSGAVEDGATRLRVEEMVWRICLVYGGRRRVMIYEEGR